MTDTPDNARLPASASPEASGGNMSVRPIPQPTDMDAFQVLLQASAAAESLQLRFSELQNRQA